MTNQGNSRETALDILMEINEKGQYLHVILGGALQKYQYLEKIDRAFISRLVRGTVERRITIDYVVNQVSKVSVDKMKPLIRNLLRMSVYQLMYMKHVPPSAVCNEAVKLAKKRHFDKLAGFVNGVLRNIIRQLPKTELPDDESIRYSVPEFLVGLLKDAYGEQALHAMLEYFLRERAITIIANPKKCSGPQLGARLEKEGVLAVPSAYIPNAFSISGFDYLEELPSFREGLFQIQDISSMIAGLIAAPKMGNRIIDVCAAPGGKSIFAAFLLAGSGHVEARDISSKKVSRIEENIERLALKNITARTADAALLCEEDVEGADIVLADVPCSGFGVIGRKPDIKYNASPEKLKEIRVLQRRILKTACRYVKKDGFIVYSTCTLNPYENEENVHFIEEQGFEAADLTQLLPEQVVCGSKNAGEAFYEKLITDAKAGYLTLLPGIHECDGFFVAKLRKKD